MIYGLLVAGMTGCAVVALRSRRLLASALWLAGVSVLTAILLYTLGGPQIAVIELSVGAGLITVLFVFAITLAPENVVDKPVIPRLLAWGLPLAAVVLVGGLLLPIPTHPGGAMSGGGQPFAVVLWQDRGLDMLVQLGLLFAAALGVAGLLAERGTETPSATSATPVQVTGPGPDAPAKPEIDPSPEVMPDAQPEEELV